MTTWGYILEMPGRPKRAKQREVLAALGVDLGPGGAWWSDKLDRAKRHRTAGQTQLTERNHLIASTQPQDVVIVASKLCLGVSGQDAAWCVEQLTAKGVTVIINGDLIKIEPGKPHATLAAEFDRELNNAAAARSRGRVH